MAAWIVRVTTHGFGPSGMRCYSGVLKCLDSHWPFAKASERAKLFDSVTSVLTVVVGNGGVRYPT